MGKVMQETSIQFINGDIAVDFDENYKFLKMPSLLVKDNKKILKIEPYSIQDRRLLFSLSKISFGIKQTIQLDTVSDLTVVSNKQIQILSNAVLSLEASEVGMICINKIDRSDLSLLSPYESNMDQKTMLQLPAVRLLNKTILFNDIHQWNLFRDSVFGDFGYLIHTTKGINYFKKITSFQQNRNVESQVDFIVDKQHITDNVLTVELAYLTSLEYVIIYIDDILINGEIRGNQITFDFSRFEEIPLCLSGTSHLQIITDHKLLIGELSFPKEEPVCITQNIVISDKKLRVLGDLKFKELPSEKLFAVANNITVSSIESTYGLLSLKFPCQITQAQLILKRRGKNIFKRFDGDIDYDNNLASFNMSLYFDENTKILNGRRWDLYVLLHAENEENLYHITSDQKIEAQKHLNYSPLIQDDPTRYTTYDQKFQYYITENKGLALVKNSESMLIAERFNLKTEVSDLRIKTGRQFQITVNVRGELLSKFIFKHVIAVNRNTQSYYKVDLPTDVVKSTETSWTARANLRLDNEKFVPFYWDIYIEVIDENNRLSLIKIEKATEKVRSLVRRKALFLQVRKAGKLLAPYITVGNNLAFVYHPVQDFETKLNYFKENLARVIEKVFRKHFRNKKIWISYEKNAMGAHDNAYAFFEYMYTHKKHDQFYYVIRKDSPELKNLSAMSDRVLKFMSLKYFIYMFSAELFISSDTKYHGYNLHQRDSHLGRRMARVKEVFLQHGVNGLKQVPAFHKKRGLLDYIIVPDEYEKQMVINQWGYDDNQVAVTGLARWDKYSDLTDTIAHRQIFVMPTWRKWMDGISPEKFVETPFYQQYQEFLSSPKLKEILTKYNVKIAFFLHPYFKNYVHLFDVDESIIDQHSYLDVDMGQEIQKSSMMISDYSSVLWDMYYLKKPVIFYQFDRSEYLKTEKSYMNYETELFGDQTFDPQSTIEAIEEYIQREFSEKQQYIDMRSKYFTYMDKRNNERIYKAIKFWNK
ncbi:CDP-glycerol glycerophosphotransferase family protein [Leuconostoc sp.]|uniref:CDP-glycerol glycerophosphotransferase family protein n=1 Tax=Leuconostoc sp. TaxID=1930076 RepID=UPI002958D5A1|nr:CDP-glycerol glycerophosphotransferase family protein [Leuconostoc sp.]MDV8936246.1 CDP-glycerol glycerophosphotransferase family protein [Leuconostoc sp.]